MKKQSAAYLAGFMFGALDRARQRAEFDRQQQYAREREASALELPKPEVPPIHVTVNLPDGAIQVQVPQQPAPVFHVPAGQAPVVNVQVPQQPAPVVEVKPQITVSVPDRPKNVIRNNAGQIIRLDPE